MLLLFLHVIVIFKPEVEKFAFLLARLFFKF